MILNSKTMQEETSRMYELLEDSIEKIEQDNFDFELTIKSSELVDYSKADLIFTSPPY